jgi:hypothetical protein
MACGSFSIAIFNREESWEQHTEAMKAAMADYLKAHASHLRGLELLEDAYVYNVDEPLEEKWDTLRNNLSFCEKCGAGLENMVVLESAQGGYTNILDVYTYASTSLQKLRNPAAGQAIDLGGLRLAS